MQLPGPGGSRNLQESAHRHEDNPLAQTIGNYQIIRELGEGHYGTVYLAIGEVPARGPQPPRRRVVAIKKLREDADSDGVSLLLQEFALLDQVKHRGIVRVFEYIEDSNAVVMEYIHGVSLRKVLDDLSRANEQVFTEAVIEIGCEVSDALYQAFTTPGDNGDPLQLVHRDLKPANIMLTPQGEVKVLDFGLARVDNADFAKDNPERIRGTPIYMAPEQARGEAVSHTTDLFAMGLILYELLMKQAAYQVSMDAPDPVEAVFQAIESGNVQAPCAELERRLPGLGPIVTRLLQSRPQDRFQNGQDCLVSLRGQVYRDRGAYLKEFCDFFFGTICHIGDAPTIDGFTDMGPAPGARTRKRQSIEERLRASMALDAHAKKTLANAGVDVRGSSPSIPDASGSRAEQFTASSGRGPSGRPVKPQPSPKVMGERRPDETGMLSMESLSDKADSREVAVDPNATEFWAIPTPKAERAKPTAPPPPPGGMAPPPMPPGGGPPPPPGGGPPRPIAQSGAPMAPAIQGPVASPSGPASSTPFKASTNAGGVNPEEQRVQSNRVYAIVFGMFGLVCLAVLILVFVGIGGDEEVSGSSEVVTQTSTKSKPVKNIDTGGPAKPPPVTRRPSRPAPGPAAARPQSSASSAGRGSVIVKLPDSAQSSGVELVCASGAYRLRKSFAGGVASFSGVPGGSCTLYFKGGIPAKFTPVTAGRSYTCNIIGTTAVCK
jgi:serine/threonine protein kinase